MQQLWVLMLQTAYFLSHLKESLMGRQSLFIRQSDLNIVHIGPDSDTNPLNITDEAHFMRSSIQIGSHFDIDYVYSYLKLVNFVLCTCTFHPLSYQAHIWYCYCGHNAEECARNLSTAWFVDVGNRGVVGNYLSEEGWVHNIRMYVVSLDTWWTIELTYTYRHIIYLFVGMWNGKSY